MKKILVIIKTTFIGGIVFLIPIVLLIVIFEKAYEVIEKITLPLVSHFPRIKVLGIALQELSGIFIIVIFCFLAGLLSRSKVAESLIKIVENSILSFIPGYSFMKKMSENIIGFERRDDLKVVLVSIEESWQFAFLIEQIDDEHFTVFIPDAPSPWSGSLFFMKKDKIKEVAISQKEALACIRKLGYGSGKLLKERLFL